MQTLYEWDMRKELDIDAIVTRNIDEFEDDADAEYIKAVVEGVVAKADAIDDKIAKAAPEWPVAQISPIDKAILRVAIHELFATDEVPPKVAINEAVELAKMFGGENSSKFINGVLGTLYRSSDRYVEETPETPVAE
jgi:N utilization substance protein B